MEPLNLLQPYFGFNQSISKIAQFPTSELIHQSFLPDTQKQGESVASRVHIDPNPSSLNHPSSNKLLLWDDWWWSIACQLTNFKVYMSESTLSCIHHFSHNCPHEGALLDWIAGFLSQLSLQRSLAWMNCSCNSAKTLLGIHLKLSSL